MIASATHVTASRQRNSARKAKQQAQAQANILPAPQQQQQDPVQEVKVVPRVISFAEAIKQMDDQEKAGYDLLQTLHEVLFSQNGIIEIVRGQVRSLEKKQNEILEKERTALAICRQNEVAFQNATRSESVNALNSFELSFAEYRLIEKQKEELAKTLSARKNELSTAITGADNVRKHIAGQVEFIQRLNLNGQLAFWKQVHRP